MAVKKTASRRLRTWRRENRGLFAFLLVLAVALVILVVGMLAATITAVTAEEGWSAAGTVGDTFGGTLGTILSFAALMATIVLALVWQPRNEAKARQRQDDEKAELRAEGVVAWLADVHPSGCRRRAYGC